MIDNDIRYIKINRFSKSAPDELVEAITGYAEKKFIFDLRDNLGGNLFSIRLIAHLFSSDISQIIYSLKYRDRKERVRIGQLSLPMLYDAEYKTILSFLAFHRGKLKKNQTVILINSGTASASEIFAGFLRDAKNATLIGENTFGKGSVQRVFYFNEGDGLHLTIAEYFVGNAEIRINKVGLEPDYWIDNPKQNRDFKEKPLIDLEHDAQLKKRLRFYEVIEILQSIISHHTCREEPNTKAPIFVF